MKKVSLLGLILAATTTSLAPAPANAQGGAVAVATPPAGCPKAFQGFGLKGNIGYGIGWGKQRITGLFNNRLGVRGVDGGVGVDYTHRFCNWALGLAFDANWTNSKGHISIVNEDIFKARLRNSLQLYARMGYVMREIAMPFIGLGWDNSQWKVETYDTSRRKRLNGFLWKAGVDFLATRHVVVGFEYTGTTAKKIRYRGNIGSFKPQYNKVAFTVKLVY